MEEQLGNNGEPVVEPQDEPEPDPDEADRFEDRAEQWQRDHCELSAPNEG